MTGDVSTLAVQTDSTETPRLTTSAMNLISGSFRGSPDERRVALLFLETVTGNKQISLRVEFSNPRFAMTTLQGKPLITQQEI